MSTPTDTVFYEVNLSDCDGANADLHVWSDGRVDLVKGTRGVMRRLLGLFRDDDAPQWVIDTLARRYPKAFRRS